ncbi:MAG: hypothetical protein E7256_16685 [Lachnospiraceae bacterium]|nr:hypothetical protein [Lachnospiraceae bacterium]
MIVDLIGRYTVVIAIVVASGYLFHWIDQLPVWLLVGMAFAVYFLGGILEVRKVRAEIKVINDLTQ